MQTIPYTYFLYHKPTGLKYYGVRYRRGCNPNDLWVKYFSSSSIIKQMIKDYGVESFDYEVRKVFVSVPDALLWESRVQTRLKVDTRDDWVNRHIQGGRFYCPGHSAETRETISKKLKGRKFTFEHKQRISEKSLIDRQRRRDTGWRMPREAVNKSIEWRKANHDTFYSKERNRKMAETKKGTKRHYLPDGSFIMIKPQDDQ